MNLGGKNILVTGSNGFVGRHMIRTLVDSNVIGIVRDLKIVPNYKFAIGDITDYQFCERVINTNDIDIVFHFAAHAIVRQASKSPTSAFKSNIEGTWTLLEACRRLGTVDAILVTSSDKVYGNKLNARENLYAFFKARNSVLNKLAYLYFRLLEKKFLKETQT